MLPRILHRKVDLGDVDRLSLYGGWGLQGAMTEALEITMAEILQEGAEEDLAVIYKYDKNGNPLVMEFSDNGKVQMWYVKKNNLVCNVFWDLNEKT